MDVDNGLEWEREEPALTKKYRRTKLVITRCSCGNILSPHEIEIDLGDGEETICDSCLYGTGAS